VYFSLLSHLPDLLVFCRGVENYVGTGDCVRAGWPLSCGPWIVINWSLLQLATTQGPGVTGRQRGYPARSALSVLVLVFDAPRRPFHSVSKLRGLFQTTECVNMPSLYSGVTLVHPGVTSWVQDPRSLAICINSRLSPESPEWNSGAERKRFEDVRFFAFMRRLLAIRSVRI
jgi:hypothetical protein